MILARLSGSVAPCPVSAFEERHDEGVISLRQRVVNVMQSGCRVVSQKREVFATFRKAAPVTSLFQSYMESLSHVSRGKSGEGDTGKRDYRHP